jgi:Neuraminidase-like domain
LWPENWLDPELRDDQSPFFKETMGELLQGDITEDAAASALMNYLTKLSEVAKLEPCGMYHAPGSAGAADSVTHVIARTAGSKRKYYYRRQELGGWTAWEEIKLGIDNNPVLPILWNDRLILLWVQILKQTPPPADTSSDDSDSPPPKPEELKFEDFFRWSKRHWAEWRASVERYDAYQRAHKSSLSSQKLTDSSLGDFHQAAKSSADEPNVTVQAVLYFSEYQDGKWLPANSSDVDTPTLIGSFAPHGPEAFDRSKLRLRAAVLPEGHLMAHLALDDRLDEPGAGFLLYNTHSAPIELGGVPPDMLHGQANRRLASYASSTLRVDYQGATTFTRDILHTQIAGRVVESQPGLPNAWEAPFIYEDSRNIFFVKTEELAQPHTALKRFTLSHPSGVGHGGTAHHFPPIVTAHQSGFEHMLASMGPPVRYDGALINAAGRVTSAPSHARRRR